MKTSEVLAAAAKHVEQGWTTGRMARDRNGNFLWSPEHPEATQWCAVGAIYKALGYNTDTEAFTFLQEKLGHISVWNDAPGRTQAEVVATLREAAAHAAQLEASDVPA